MNASGVDESLLRKLLERAVATGYKVSNVEFKPGPKGTSEMRFLFHCSAVVNTAKNAKQAWQALATRYRVPCKFMDPVVQNATSEDEQVSTLSEDDMAEVFSAAASVDGSKLAKLAELVDRYVELESEIEALDEQSGQRGKELHKLRMETIPQIMREARITEQNMDSGHRVTLGTAIGGTWPKDEKERQRAMKALEALGAPDLVKQTITITFSPEDHKVAKEVIAYLKRKKVDASVDRTIHPQTYRAWAREMLVDEKTAPTFMALLNDLGLIVMDQATVKEMTAKQKRRAK